MTKAREPGPNHQFRPCSGVQLQFSCAGQRAGKSKILGTESLTELRQVEVGVGVGAGLFLRLDKWVHSSCLPNRKFELPTFTRLCVSKASRRDTCLHPRYKLIHQRRKGGLAARVLKGWDNGEEGWTYTPRSDGGKV